MTPEVLRGSNMMQSPTTTGTAESGYGVKLSGFYCRSIEYGRYLEDLASRVPYSRDIAVFEDHGFILFLALEEGAVSYAPQHKVAIFRRETHKFFPDLAKFLASHRVENIHHMILSGSGGSVVLTLLYKPADA